LTAEVAGEIDTSDDGVLVVRRVHVRYLLRADPAHREVVERVLGFHARKCPVARTIEGCLEVTTELELLPEAS
jgi:uncharacterized OsmC-like protein